MKSILPIAVFVVGLSVCLHAQAPQSSLNNSSIAKLVSAGLPEDEIIRIINSQPGTYATNLSDLMTLQQAGATSNVIAAVASHQDATATPTSSPAPTPAFVSAGILRDGTSVRLRLSRTLSSAQATTGEKVDFEVMEDIMVDGKIVIPKGVKAIGSITDAEAKKRMGRGGKLNVVLEFVRLADGTKVALHASRNSSGGGHTGAMTAGIVASALVIWPAAPFFLFMHGKDAVIPEGTDVMAYVDGDVHLGTGTSTVASR